MNYTFTREVGNGVNRVFAFSFAGADNGYIDLSRDLRVFVGGVPAAFTTRRQDPNKVTLNTAPPVGAEVLIRRVMPSNLPYSDFKTGNAFNKDTVNRSFLQQLYLTQELLDGFLPDGFYWKQDLNMGGHKVINMANGTNPGDAVNFGQLDAVDQKHTSWNTQQDAEINALKEGIVSNVGIRTVPWLHVGVGGEDTISPPFQFSSAWVWRTGVMQYQLAGAYEIVDNTIMLAEALEAGEEVLIAMGSGAAAPDDHPTYTEVLHMISLGLRNAPIRVNSVTGLRSVVPVSNDQQALVSGYYSERDKYGGGLFISATDSVTTDDGGSFIRSSPTTGWVRSINSGVSLHDFGANGTLARDEPAKNNAMLFCGKEKIDLDVLPGTYFFSTPLLWKSRNHSIQSQGNVVFDFTNCTAGSYTIRVVEQAQSEGTIWHGITHSVNGISFYGKPGIHGLIINQANEFSTPAINIDNCFFNEFDDHITFGNNEWICAFRRCFFRGNTNGTSRFVVVNKNYNACENQRFESCTFGGNQTALAIKHITGSCEFTFDGCSFDYNKGVLQSVNPGTRGIWRFTNCHFEDAGEVRNFDIDTGTATSYIDLIGCDWYFTHNLPTKIGTFKSTNPASTLNIISCKLTIFQEVQDRSVIDLFTSDTSGGSRFKINTDANTIEMSSNMYFNVLCAANNLYPRLTEANLTSGQFTFNGTGTTVFSNTDYPAGSTSQSWIVTGGREAYAFTTYNPNKRLAISGWIRKSADYFVEVRFLSSENVSLGTQTLGIPGALGTWLKFGQMINPPAGTSKIRLGWRFPSGVTAGDSVSINNWIIEQY